MQSIASDLILPCLAISILLQRDVAYRAPVAGLFGRSN